MDQKPAKRICICGTAPTWRDAPFDDPSVEFWMLNDMHLLNPPRADRWFDLHPLDKMFFRGAGQKMQGHDVPAGFFLRPAGHLEWLRKQQIPVYVQDAAALGSPSARTFPREAIVQRFGPNFASSPAWMVALAMLEGATEIFIYGIHLATEWEYQKQKPNLTFLMGIAAGLGITCNAICPGYVKTPLIEAQIVDQAKTRGIPEDRVMEDVILAAQPTKKFVEYEHLAGMLLYLASDVGASATGAALSVDGGWTAT
jgi:hypothetical protein